MDVWKGCWGTFAELSCKHTLQILSCTHSTHTAALTLSALYVITASLQTTVGVCYCCLMSRWWTRVRVVELLLVSATAAAPSHYTAWSPVSTILAPLCRGKAAVSFPAAPACSTTVCVPTAECAHTAALQHDPALQPCPGCCEETAHALTMHCIALLLVCTAGRRGTLTLPLQWCYLLWIESISRYFPF